MKKIWVSILALSLVLALSGCGHKEETAEQTISGAVEQMEDGFDKLEDSLDELENTLDGSDSSQGEADGEEAEQEAPSEQPEETEAPVADDSIRPEIKEAIDGYESFFTEYAEFMQKYNSSDDALGMMNDYLSMLQQYTESMEGFEKMEDMEMNDAEVKYYAEAQLRISQLLLSAVE